MKSILIQLTIFISISSFAQYNGSGRVSLSQFSKGTPVLLLAYMPGGGGGNGPYKNARNELIRQIEENQEEIVEKAKLLAERMGYDYDSLEVIIAVPSYEEAGQFVKPSLAGYAGNIEFFEEKGIGFEIELEDVFSGTKIPHLRKRVQSFAGENYIISPGGGGGNGPYKEMVKMRGQEEVLTGEKIRGNNRNTLKLTPFSIGPTSYPYEEEIKKWKATGLVGDDISAIERGEINFGGKLLQITEKQIEAVEQNGIVNAFSDYNWNDEAGQDDVRIQFAIKTSPEISAFGSSVWSGYAHTTERVKMIKAYSFDDFSDDMMKDPSSAKIIYAEPLGGGGESYLIQIK